MDKPHVFGGFWTREKLLMLKKYLSAFTIALKNTRFKKIYIDAFAGTGKIHAKKDDDDDVIMLDLPPPLRESKSFSGSARIALETHPQFDAYYFIDLKMSHEHQLLSLCEEYPEAKTKVFRGDANKKIKDILDSLGENDRAVLFLDPYGMSLDWNTLEYISKCKMLDIWYLFDISSISRLLPTKHDVPESNIKKMTAIYGDDSWLERFYYKDDQQVSLFSEGDSGLTRQCNPQAIIDYTIEKMGSIFSYIDNDPRVFYNNKNVPLFILFFAMTNPSEAAKKLAIPIAKHILKKERMFDKMK